MAMPQHRRRINATSARKVNLTRQDTSTGETYLDNLLRLGVSKATQEAVRQVKAEEAANENDEEAPA